MKKILVVEDNEENLLLIKYLLEKSNFKVIVAMDGAEGVKMAANERPDLILMDIQLPEINGLEATKRIRATEAGRSIPIIALTSYAMPADREQALEAGCTEYIEKPINTSTIVAQIERYL